jgi:hypothetical protein
MHDFLESRLVNRNLALPKQFDFAEVVIDTDYIVADVGEAGALLPNRHNRNR